MHTQDAFNVPLVIQLTDDEKAIWKGLGIDESRRLAREVRPFWACCLTAPPLFLCAVRCGKEHGWGE